MRCANYNLPIVAIRLSRLAMYSVCLIVCQTCMIHGSCCQSKRQFPWSSLL